MYQASKRTSTAIALRIKPFVWCLSRCRRRRGLPKLPIVVRENIRIHPSTRYRIRCGYIFFHSGERIYFFSGFAVEFAGYVRTVAVSGKKKLRFENMRIRVDGT